MVSIIVDVVLITIFSIVALGLLGWMIYSIISYNRVINNESSSCPLYSCGLEGETTDASCNTGISNSQPMYAYRINKEGKVECQKDTATYFEQYKKNG